MYKSTLFKYLRTFKREEWKPFKKYLSNSIGEQTDPYRLFELIEKKSSDLDHKDMNLEKIEKKIFPLASRKTLLNYLSKLSKEIEGFWISEEIKADSTATEIFKLKAFNRRGFYKRADKIGHALRRDLSAPQRLDLWDAYHLLAVNHELYFSYNPIKDSKMGPEILKQSLLSAWTIADNFSSYYHIEAIGREKRKHENWREILRKIENKIDAQQENELRSILEICSSLYKNKDEHSFNLLKQILFDSNKKISEDLSISFFILIKTYLAISLGNGNLSANKSYVDFIYQGQVMNKNMYKGQLSNEIFLGNIAGLVNLGGYDKAKALIEDARNKLPRDHREESLTIAKMALWLGQGNYSKMIAIYQKEHYNSMFYKLRAIPLVLRASFERQDGDVTFIEYQIRNYKYFLRRHRSEISTRQYEGQGNFLTILVMMVKKKTKNKILNAMKEMGIVFYRSWIMKKIEEV